MTIIMLIAGLVVGSVAFMIYVIEASHRDYEQVASCLNRHGFEVEDGWKVTDMGLEDFGLTFRLPDGQLWEVHILDGSSPRDCNDRVAGVLLSNDAFKKGQYLAFASPELTKDLNGQAIDTMDDMFARFEWLLSWAKDHPEALLNYDDIANRENYVSLLSPPL